jgi:transcriptional regulator NrdR family protein
MKCPNTECGRKIQVSDSREKEGGCVVKRRRRCNHCNQAWTTCEIIQTDSTPTNFQPPLVKTNLPIAEIFTEVLRLLISLGKSMGLKTSL